MTYDQLVAFTTVAAEGTFTSASEARRVVPARYSSCAPGSNLGNGATTGGPCGSVRAA